MMESPDPLALGIAIAVLGAIAALILPYAVR
jgi:hypothetical protein